jgi:hypothetical protein
LIIVLEGEYNSTLIIIDNKIPNIEIDVIGEAYNNDNKPEIPSVNV